MTLLRMQNRTPPIYCEESRDFQLFCRLYDTIINGLLFDIDTITDLINTKNIRSSFLQLLQTKLGFFTIRTFDERTLRYVLSGFPTMIKNKGSKKSIEYAVNTFLKINNILSPVTVTYQKTPLLLNNGYTIPDHTVVVGISSSLQEASILREIFRYIIPFGTGYYFYYYSTTSELVTLLQDDNAIILYISDNINSILRSDTEDDFMDSFKNKTNEKKRLIGGIDTINLITNTFGELGDLIFTDSISDSLKSSIITFNSNSRSNIKSLVADINPVQAGSGNPSPSNVRTIAGFTNVNLSCVGRNLLVDNRVYPFTYNQITTNRNADGSYQITGNKTNSSAVIFMPNFASASATSTSNQYDYKKWLPNGSYKGKVIAEGLPAGAVVKLQVYGYNSLASAPTLTHLGSGTDFSFSVTDAYPFIFCRLLFDTGTYSNLNAKIMPMIYRADETNIPWDAPRSSKSISLGRTVYGGKLNVTTGELTVTHGSVDMGSLTWTYHAADTTHPLGYFYTASISDKKAGELNFISSVYKTQNGIGVWSTDKIQCGNANNKTVYVVDTLYSTGDALKTAVTGQRLVYELATAQTYQLTPQEVTTLLEENNIWIDSGDTTIEFTNNSFDPGNDLQFLGVHYSNKNLSSYISEELNNPTLTNLRTIIVFNEKEYLYVSGSWQELKLLPAVENLPVSDNNAFDIRYKTTSTEGYYIYNGTDWEICTYPIYVLSQYDMPHVPYDKPLEEE